MGIIDDNDFNLIEDFISGNLSPEEEKIFRKRIETDEDLAKAYRFRTKISKSWNESQIYETTKKQVKDIINKEQKRSKKSFTLFYAAASVIVLIGISFFYLQKQKQVNSSNRLTKTKSDIMVDTVSPLSGKEQPVKSTKYLIPHEYSNNDTFIIYRQGFFKDTEIILITQLLDKRVYKEYKMGSGSDSLIIPLKDYQPGSYRWVINGTDSSGQFIVKGNPQFENQK